MTTPKILSAHRNLNEIDSTIEIYTDIKGGVRQSHPKTLEHILG